MQICHWWPASEQFQLSFLLASSWELRVLSPNIFQQKQTKNMCAHTHTPTLCTTKTNATYKFCFSYCITQKGTIFFAEPYLDVSIYKVKEQIKSY